MPEHLFFVTQHFSWYLSGQTGFPPEPETPFRPTCYAVAEHLSTGLIIFNPKMC
jgi:hypothetical protein